MRHKEGHTTIQLALTWAGVIALSIGLSACNKSNRGYGSRYNSGFFGAANRGNDLVPDSGDRDSDYHPRDEGFNRSGERRRPRERDPIQEKLREYAESLDLEFGKELANKELKEGKAELDRRHDARMKGIYGEVRAVDGKERKKFPRWAQECSKVEPPISINSICSGETKNDSDCDGIPDKCEDYLRELGWEAMRKDAYNGWQMKVVKFTHEQFGVTPRKKFGQKVNEFLGLPTKFNKALAAEFANMIREDGSHKSNVHIIDQIMGKGTPVMPRHRRIQIIDGVRFDPQELLHVKGGYGSQAVAYDHSDAPVGGFRTKEISGVGSNTGTIKDGEMIGIAFYGNVYLPRLKTENQLWLATRKDLHVEEVKDESFMVFQGHNLDIAYIPNQLMYSKGNGLKKKSPIIEPNFEFQDNGECPTPVYGFMALANRKDSEWPATHLYFELDEGLVELPPQEVSLLTLPEGCKDLNEVEIFGGTRHPADANPEIEGLTEGGDEEKITEADKGNLTINLEDEEGNKVTNAVFTILNEQTSETVEGLWNSNGQYVLTGLIPGTYYISAEVDGRKLFYPESVGISAGGSEEILMGMSEPTDQKKKGLWKKVKGVFEKKES